MKVTRKQKREFFQAALELLESDPWIHTIGLCNILERTCFDNPHTSLKETTLIKCKRVLRKSKPSVWKPRTWRFLRHPSYTGSNFWWDILEREQRIKFLKFIIFKLTWL